MKFENWQSVATMTTAVVLLSLFAGSAHAMFTPYCDRPAPAGINKMDMSPAFTACQNSTMGPVNDSAAEVNFQEFFDPMGTEPDWVEIGKQDTDVGDPATPGSIGLDVTCDGGCQSDTGTWSFFSSVWDTYADVMIVMKGSNEFSGYLLENMISMGKWDTGGDPLLSHLTVYARGDSPGGGDIPEPATLGLLALGMIAARCSRKRKAH